MSTELRVLIVEDSEDDELLLLRALRQGGFEPSYLRVETPAAMRAALREQPWEIIISDYVMPQFSALAALRLLADEGLDLPLIIVSGTIGEETAVEAMQAGASDYLMKGNLTRLAPAIRRELNEATGRRERRRAELARQIAEARFAGVLATAAEAIIAVDEQQRIVLFNPSAERMFGYRADEALGQPLDMLLPPGLIATHRQHIRSFASAPEQSRAMGKRHGELYGLRKDGSQFPIDASIAKLHQNGETTFTVFLQDISQRKQLEAQLLQAQKMESIGRLAGGIAHDFNNLLTVISGYSEMLLASLADQDPRHGDVEEIRRAAERASALTRQLLAFSRKQILAPQVLDINAIVADMNKLLVRLIGEDVRLLTALDPGLGQIRADPSQIEQVIVNLAVNARDAMPEGGTLTIETQNVDLDAESALQHMSLEPGRYVLLAVSDTGVGMAAEVQAHIFEPFFTTKAPGKGTGLGLATVYGIVTQSGGSIWVYSELGMGTTFKIYLPQSHGEVAPAAPPEPLALVPAREQTILLVEDNAAVRALMRRILEQSGYTILEAASGAEAIAAAENHDGPIHLLLTDMVMPEMSGQVLAQRLERLRPTIRVLYASGYTENAIVHHGTLAGAAIFLQKPFTTSELIHKVREVLEL
jgi:two-component system, cell cycle sensor histidine kinase and response regulator CckA